MNDKERRAQAFRDELRMLLRKYQASIEYEAADGSDFQGVYEERIVVRNGLDEELIRVDGTSVYHDDLN